jgi:dTMP kinase
MSSDERKGLFIVIEGLDGAGTTTQSDLLAEWLGKKGYRPVVTREPTQGPIGGALRDALRHRIKLDEKTLAMMFFADRLDHLYNPQEGIAQILMGDDKNVIISDRYSLSTFAYQTLDGKLDLDWLITIHSICLRPDLTFFLDIPALESARRIAINRGLHLERYEETKTLAAIRESYLRAIDVLNQKGENIQIIDGNATIEQVVSRIRQRVDAFLKSGRVRLEDLQEFLKENIFDAVLRAYGKEALEKAREERISLVGAQRVDYGLQVSLSDGSDICHVIFYSTKKVIVSGKESPLKANLVKLLTFLTPRYSGVYVIHSRGRDYKEDKAEYKQADLFS